MSKEENLLGIQLKQHAGALLAGLAILVATPSDTTASSSDAPFVARSDLDRADDVIPMLFLSSSAQLDARGGLRDRLVFVSSPGCPGRPKGARERLDLQQPLSRS